jgi:hypothetical protein
MKLMPLAGSLVSGAGQKASNAEPTVESLRKFGHSEDLAAVDRPPDAGVRQIGYEVEETE